MKSTTVDVISYVFLYVSLTFSLSIFARAIALGIL
jgi:hypothetical protein